MTDGPVTLAAALNAALGTHFADAAEARAWLADGSWPELESWLAVHHNDRPRRAVRPPRETR